VRSMLDGVSLNLTENEFKLLQIPKYHIFKRREFSNIYKTLLLYLTKLSIPKAFPEKSNEILKLFNELYDIAYKSKEPLKKDIDNDLEKFTELTHLEQKDRFFELSRYIVERLEKRPRKALFIVLLNDRINSLYNNFINIGKPVELIYDPKEINIIEKLREKEKKN
ncbi:hypothetical protein KKD19_00665, partial [Patescibacteria group bacterium]|nr:hypothetical protein [Patescibacteria group bacterium]